VGPTAPAAEDDDEDDEEEEEEEEEEADKNEEDNDDKKKPHLKGGGSRAPREPTVTGGSGVSAASEGTGDDANDGADADLEAFLRRGEAQGAGQWWRGGGPLAARPTHGAAATEEGWLAAAFGAEAAVPDELDARHLGVEFPTTWASAAFREVKKKDTVLDLSLVEGV
jgi:hypothetical protein